MIIVVEHYLIIWLYFSLLNDFSNIRHLDVSSLHSYKQDCLSSFCALFIVFLREIPRSRVQRRKWTLLRSLIGLNEFISQLHSYHSMALSLMSWIGPGYIYLLEKYTGFFLCVCLCIWNTQLFLCILYHRTYSIFTQLLKVFLYCHKSHCFCLLPLLLCHYKQYW